MKFINFLKDLFYSSKLGFLNEGDIIFHERYNNNEKLGEIEEGHKIGPYVVTRKKGRKVYGLRCAGPQREDTLQVFKQRISKDKYNLEKDTFAYTGREELLSKKKYKRTVDFLDKEDLNRIHKAMYIVKQRFDRLNLMFDEPLDFYITEGDVILYNNRRYYVLETDEEYYYLLRVYNDYTKKEALRMNDKLYTFNYSKIKKVSKDEEVELINMADEELQETIRNSYDEYQKELIESKTLSRGKLIKLNNELYYIYGEERNELLIIKLYLDGDKKYKILINAQEYYTLFEESTCTKEDRIKIVSAATDEEKKDIKYLKGQAKKESKPEPVENVVERQDDDFIPGRTIMHRKTRKKFLILRREGDIVYFAAVNNLTNVKSYDLNQSGFDFEVIEPTYNTNFNMKPRKKRK